MAYVQELGGHFELRSFYPLLQVNERVQLMTERADAIVWRTARAEVISVRADGAYATSRQRRPGKSRIVGDAAPPTLTAHDGWLAAQGQGLLAVGATQAANGATTCAPSAVTCVGFWRKLSNPKSEVSSQPGDGAPFAERHPMSAGSISSAAPLRRQPCAWLNSLCSTIGQEQCARARQRHQPGTQDGPAGAGATGEPLAAGGRRVFRPEPPRAGSGFRHGHLRWRKRASQAVWVPPVPARRLP